MMERFKLDWTVNITNVLTVIVFLAGCITAWYDLKSDVRIQSAKIVQFEKFVVDQRHADEIQDQQRDRLGAEIKESLKDTKNDIKQEIRDLRTDLIRKPASLSR